VIRAAGLLAIGLTASTLSACELGGDLPAVVGVSVEGAMPTIVLACGSVVSVFRNEPTDPPKHPFAGWSLIATAPSGVTDIPFFSVPIGWRDVSVPTNDGQKPSFPPEHLTTLERGVHYTASSGAHGEARAHSDVTFTMADLDRLGPSQVLVGGDDSTAHVESRTSFLHDAAGECR
jgi:hypothetical protein